MKFDVFRVMDSHECHIPHVPGMGTCVICGRLYRENSDVYKEKFDQWHHGYENMANFGPDRTIEVVNELPIFDTIGDFSDVPL